VSDRGPSSGRQRRESGVCGVSSAKDGERPGGGVPERDSQSTATPAQNVLQDIASALGGVDFVASWLYWERRTSASCSPLDGASDERRAVILKALERVEKAHCKPHTG